MPLHLICIYLIISIVITTFFSAFIQSRGKGDYVKVIFLLSLAVDCYMFGYVLELASVSMEQKLFWNCFQYLGIPFVSALWLTVSLMYTNHFYSHLKVKLILIFAIPFMTFILRFTNELHHLYFTQYLLEYYNQFSLLIKNGGIWYEIQGYHSGLMILISMFLYISAFIKNKDFSSEKTIYMIGASLIACIGLLVTKSGMSLDYTVLCLPIIMLLILMAIFRNDFLEVTMLARELVFENSDIGIIVFNNRLKVLDFNEAAGAIMKQQQILLEKKDLDTVIPKDHPLNEHLRTSIANTWKAKDAAGVKYYEITTTKVFRKSGIVYGMIKTFRDITEVQVRTNHLKVQATVDELSGLLNRSAFINSCQSSLNSSLMSEDRYFLFMLDLDFFKCVNDTYGHAAGDYVIESFGKLMKQKFEPTGFIGRLGGEEFAVYLKAEDLDSAFAKAEQFRKSVGSGQFIFKSRTLRFTVSIGITEAQKTASISELINQADKALYVSKNNGRNKTSIYERSGENSKA